MTNDEQAFRAAIKASLFDPLPRLLFADWLNEQRRDDEAEQQRQCAAELPNAVAGIQRIIDIIGPFDQGYGDSYKDFTVEELIEAATAALDGRDDYGLGEYLTEIGSETWRNEFPAHAAEFWRHYAVITGEATADRSDNFFSCSC